MNKKEITGMCPLCKSINCVVRKNNTDPSGSHNPIFINGYPSVCPNEGKQHMQVLAKNVYQLKT